MSFTIAIDVGGTFTDVVATDESRLFTGKVPSRPNDEATAVLDAVRIVAQDFGKSQAEILKATRYFILGTTVVTNAMLEYGGTPTGLITTKGFRDVLELRQGYKESLVDLRLP